MPTFRWFRAIPAAAKNMLYLRRITLHDSEVSAVEGALNNFRLPDQQQQRLRRLQRNGR